MMYHMSELVHKLHPHCSIIKSPLSTSFFMPVGYVHNFPFTIAFLCFQLSTVQLAAHIRYFTLCPLILIYFKHRRENYGCDVVCFTADVGQVC